MFAVPPKYAGEDDGGAVVENRVLERGCVIVVLVMVVDSWVHLLLQFIRLV